RDRDGGDAFGHWHGALDPRRAPPVRQVSSGVTLTHFFDDWESPFMVPRPANADDFLCRLAHCSKSAANRGRPVAIPTPPRMWPLTQLGYGRSIFAVITTPCFCSDVGSHAGWLEIVLARALAFRNRTFRPAESGTGSSQNDPHCFRHRPSPRAG